MDRQPMPGVDLIICRFGSVMFREHPHIQRNVRKAIVTTVFRAELGLNPQLAR
jgi:hypothetical protein